MRKGHRTTNYAHKTAKRTFQRASGRQGSLTAACSSEAAERRTVDQ